jgi:hypothetical protein
MAMHELIQAFSGLLMTQYLRAISSHDMMIDQQPNIIIACMCVYICVALSTRFSHHLHKTFGRKLKPPYSCSCGLSEMAHSLPSLKNLLPHSC